MARKILCVLLLLVAHISAFGEECLAERSDANGPTILFVNGIMNTFDDGCSSLGSLKNTLVTNGEQITDLNFEFLYNPTNNPFGDVNELRIQAGMSARATRLDTTNSRDGYYKQLGTIYKSLLVNEEISKTLCLKYEIEEFDLTAPLIALTGSAALGLNDIDRLTFIENICGRVYYPAVWLAGRMSTLAADKGVVVVAHSQGNFYVEAAYALLVATNDPNLHRIRVVGVAAISKTSPSGRYVTLSDDNALYLLQRDNVSMLNPPGYDPLPPTNSACVKNLVCIASTGGGINPETLGATTGSTELPIKLRTAFGYPSGIYMMHEFVDVYLNPNIVDKTSGEVLPKLIVDNIASAVSDIKTPPVISILDLQPRNVSVGTLTTFTITGTNLPATHLDVSFDGCSNISFVNQSSLQHTFTCTPVASGVLQVDIRLLPAHPIIGFYNVVANSGSAIVGGWCGQTLTFNGGVLPSNWSQSLLFVGPGLSNNRLVGEGILGGSPNAGAIISSSPMASISPTAKIVVDYTADYVSNATNYSGFEIATNSGASLSIFIIGVTPGLAGGYGNIRVVQDGLFTVAAGTILSDPHYTMTSGVQSVHMEITNSTALVKVTSASDRTIMTGTFPIPALLSSTTTSRHFAYTNGVAFGVPAQVWTDDLSIQCLQ